MLNFFNIGTMLERSRSTSCSLNDTDSSASRELLHEQQHQHRDQPQQHLLRVDLHSPRARLTLDTRNSLVHFLQVRINSISCLQP